MSPIKEIDALRDFGLTLDHFYGLIKAHAGNLDANQFLQLQLSAVPLAVDKTLPWYSWGLLTQFFDTSIAPNGTASNIAIETRLHLSSTFRSYVGTLLSLIEAKSLDQETLKRIDFLEVEVRNLGTQINDLLNDLLANWVAYCNATGTDKGDLFRFKHWSDGQAAAGKMNELREEQNRKYAMQAVLRDKQYANQDEKDIFDAFARILSPASRMRLPRWPDNVYGDEQKKFSMVYFATLPDNESGPFTNFYMFNPSSPIATITDSDFGRFTETIKKNSEAKSKISTDWSGSAEISGSAFSLKADANGSEEIKEDFTHVQEISVGARALLAIPIFPASWFSPGLFDSPIARKNRRLFERFLGANGTLLYYPTHLVVARGLNLTFKSSQNWQYNYKGSFSAGGSASATAFGINFGSTGSYDQSRVQQLVETRGHDLVLDDGEKNVRIIGFKVKKNTGFLSRLVADVGAQFNETELLGVGQGHQ